MAQLEQGELASSPIPTTTAAITLRADIVSLPLSLPSLNPVEGSLHVEFVPVADFPRVSCGSSPDQQR
jgi:hypothetical protein